MSGISIIPILYAFILILIALIILILVVPSELSFLLVTEGLSLEAEMNFSVLSGFLKGSMTSYAEGGSFELYLATFPIYKVKQKKGKERKEIKPRKRRPPQESLSLFRKLYGPFVRLLRAVLRYTHVKELDCRIDVGLPDPVHTGMVYGISYPLWETIHPLIPNGTFAISPVFTEEVFNASLKGSISLRIALILVPLLKLFTKKEFRMLRKR